MTAKEALALTNANRPAPAALSEDITKLIQEAAANGRAWCQVPGAVGIDYKEALLRAGYKVKEHKAAPWHFIVSWEGVE